MIQDLFFHNYDASIKLSPLIVSEIMPIFITLSSHTILLIFVTLCGIETHPEVDCQGSVVFPKTVFTTRKQAMWWIRIEAIGVKINSLLVFSSKFSLNEKFYFDYSSCLRHTFCGFQLALQFDEIIIS